MSKKYVVGNHVSRLKYDIRYNIVQPISKHIPSHPITSFSFRPQHYFYWMSPFPLESHLTGEACDYFLLSFINAQNYVLACIFCIVWCQQISIWNKQIESSIYYIKQVGKCLKHDDQIRREHRKSRF